MLAKEEFLLKAFELGIIKFGKFTLKSGIESPFYVDLRPLASSPHLLKTLSNSLLNLVDNAPFELICGVPYAALPMGTTMSLESGIPLIIKRKENKGYGTKRMLEGVYSPGQNCLLVEDVITSGKSLIETIAEVEKENLKVTDIAVVLDREQGGIERLKEKGYKVHTLFTINEVIDTLLKFDRLTEAEAQRIKDFLNTPPEFNKPIPKTPYENRTLKNPYAKRLIDIALAKKSNLILSADLVTTEEILSLVEKVADSIVAVKLHSDIITNFNSDFVSQLKELAKAKNFLIIEDRKFADIGNTQELQFKRGLFRISEWADLVTAHPIAGMESLKVFDSVGVITIVEMSSKGTLTDSYYVNLALNASQSSPNVIGVVAQRKIGDQTLLFTPGINLSQISDQKGQQFNSPAKVFSEKHSDFIIVGRGIYQADKPVEAAENYRKVAWEAYLEATQIK